ncbi:hypothetical protein BZG02_09295 [Labilibaculum filiforme]|uniref:Tetratricopeptide repeat protein n=2 Tax=Labilibaculum filiforme TaxID=1940526 RepID=A0A2N3HZR3_9BACT|nr:hypothetical protein BZG02_09295 [Labilibaculum filiforme]
MGISIVGNAQENYIEYHKQVNQAKLQITLENFESALVTYQTVFAQYPKHFYRDVHNACVCAIRCEKYSEAETLAKELVVHGYELEDFEQSAFDAFRNSNKWKSFSSEYTSLRKEYEEGLNVGLRNKYYQLFKEDQMLASSGGGYGTLKNDKDFLELSIRLKTYYELDGIPNYVHNKDTLNLKYWILYRHYFGMKNNADNHPEIKENSNLYKSVDALNWQTILLTELRNGNIEPQFYADAVVYHDPTRPFGKPALKVDFEKEKVSLFMNMKEEERNEINANREAIGLFALNEENSDILRTSWYGNYPFQQINDSLKRVTSSDPMAKLKVIKKYEADAKSLFQKSSLDDFFLGDYKEIKETHFFGL